MPESTLATNRSTNVGARATLATLLAVQIIIGWEWLASGITKVASGNFVSGLAANLKMGLDAAPSWYRGFLTGTAIPNARAFAVLIWVGEIFVGLVLMVGAIVWLARWSRLSDRARGASGSVDARGARRDVHGCELPSRQRRQPSVADPQRRVQRDDRHRCDAVHNPGAYLVFCGYLLVQIRNEHRATSSVSTSSASAPGTRVA